MARYYHLDVARWEGEGGAPIRTPAPWATNRQVEGHHRKDKSLIVVQVLLGALLLATLIYARRK